MLRWATRADVEMLVAHRRAMFFAMGGHPESRLEAADPVYRRWISSRLRSGRAVAVVASVNGTPVGSAVAWLREDQPRPGWSMLRIPYILSVYVRADQRGRGIASAMTRRLLAWAKENGYPRTVLHASIFGRTVYARLGFERTWEMRFGGSYRTLPEGPVPLDEVPGRTSRRRHRRPR